MLNNKMIEEFARIYEAEKLRIQRRRAMKAFVIMAVLFGVFVAFCEYDFRQINQIPPSDLPVHSNYSPAEPTPQPSEEIPWEKV